MFHDIDNQIKSVKKILRKKSENYIQNFNKIKHFINIEIEEIQKLKNLNQPIIPEINFDSNEVNNDEIISESKLFLKTHLEKSESAAKEIDNKTVRNILLDINTYLIERSN